MSDPGNAAPGGGIVRTVAIGIGWAALVLALLLLANSGRSFIYQGF